MDSMSDLKKDDWGIEDSETIHEVMFACGFSPAKKIMTKDIRDGFRVPVGDDHFQLFTPRGNPFVKHRRTCVFYISKKELGWICRCLSEDIDEVVEYFKNLMDIEGPPTDNGEGKDLGVLRFARAIKDLTEISVVPLSKNIRPYLYFHFRLKHRQEPRIAWDFRGESAVHRLDEATKYLQKLKLPVEITHGAG